MYRETKKRLNCIRGDPDTRGKWEYWRDLDHVSYFGPLGTRYYIQVESDTVLTFSNVPRNRIFELLYLNRY